MLVSERVPGILADMRTPFILALLAAALLVACRPATRMNITAAQTGSLNQARRSPTATLLSNGLVLAAGGYAAPYIASARPAYLT